MLDKFKAIEKGIAAGNDALDELKRIRVSLELRNSLILAKELHQTGEMTDDNYKRFLRDCMKLNATRKEE